MVAKWSSSSWAQRCTHADIIHLAKLEKNAKERTSSSIEIEGR